MAGMPARAAVFVDGSPVFDTLEGFKGTVIARYPETGSPLLSGYLIGEKYLHGKAAAVEAELDQGRVILLGFRPQWRGQPFGTFRVLFNARSERPRALTADVACNVQPASRQTQDDGSAWGVSAGNGLK